MRIEISITGFLLTLFVISRPVVAQEAQVPATSDVEVTWDQVRAVFQKRCFACHRGEQARGGLDLSTVAAIKAGATSGASVVSGKPEESMIYTLPAHLENPKMPPNGARVPQRELDLIHKWILGGLSEKTSELPVASRSSSRTAASRPLPRPRPQPASRPKQTLAPAMPTGTAVAAAEQPVGPARPSFAKAIRHQAGVVTAMATSPVSSLLAISGQQQILLYDWTDRSLRNVMAFPEGDVFILRFSRDGSLLIAGGGKGSESGKVVAFETSTGERVFEVGNETDVVLAADISPDGHFVALGGPSRVVRLYDTTNGNLISEIRKHTDWILQIAFSHDGLLVASADRFGSICVSEGSSGKHFMTLRGHTGAICGLSWSADSSQLFSASHDGAIRVRDLHTGLETQQILPGSGRLLAFDRDASGRLVFGSSMQKVSVMSPEGRLLTSASMSDEVTHLQITQDATHVIASDAIGNITLFSMEDGQSAGQISPPPAAARIQ